MDSFLCPNCESRVPQDSAFCPGCGQKTHLPRLGLREVIQKAFQSLTNVDRGLLPLLKDLIVHPGVAAREYIHGKRRKHFPPLNFFLLVSTVMIVILSFSSKPKQSGNGGSDLSGIKDPARRVHVEKIYERSARSRLFLSNYSDIIAMVAVPLIAFIFWIFYPKLGYNYTEHLIGCMYMISFMNLVWAVCFVPLTSLLTVSHQGSGMIVEGVHKVVEMVYFSFFYRNFTSNEGTRSMMRPALVSVLVVIVWTMLTSLMITLYITNGFFGLIE